MSDSILAQYDLTGWTRAAERYPVAEDCPVWVWVMGNLDVHLLEPGTGILRRDSNVFWKRASVPPPPRRKTDGEMEQDAILETWRRQSIDFANDDWTNVTADFVRAWRAGREYQKSISSSST